MTNELLERYFKNQCTSEERELVSRYLSELDELPEQLLPKAEWDAVTEENLPTWKSAEMFGKINASTLQHVRNRKIWVSIAAAAIIIAVLGLFFEMQRLTQSKTNLTANEKKETTKADIIYWRSTINYTDNIETTQLPDGSTIKVYPGAEIRYAKTYIKNKREIFLMGKCYFNVAKDKDHPFVVYANGVSTTALGTAFTITTKKTSKAVKVELHSGKVEVKKTGKANKALFLRVLTAGSSLEFDGHKLRINVPAMKKNQETVLGDSIVFSQVKLNEVFPKLAQQFHVKITFEDKHLEGQFFTGTIQANASLDQVLTDITELNQLKLVKTDTGYLISK